MIQDLNKPVNEWLKSVDQYIRTSIYGMLVILCLVATAISWARSERAIDAANASLATADTWQTMYSETERECRLAQMEVDDFRIILAKDGYVSHVGEKP